VCNCKKEVTIPGTPVGRSLGSNPITNLVRAGSTQESKLKWFKDGLSGLIKCIGTTSKYDDETIKRNREICRGCEHSTKNAAGVLYSQSQCMAPDPAKDGAQCGCFILCKTQVDVCPLSKWTHLTIGQTDS